MLTIRGERRDEQRTKGHHEFHYGALTRSVRLPRDVDPDAVHATYTDGVLEVKVPTRQPDREPKRIPVARAARSADADKNG